MSFQGNTWKQGKGGVDTVSWSSVNEHGPEGNYTEELKMRIKSTFSIFYFKDYVFVMAWIKIKPQDFPFMPPAFTPVNFLMFHARNWDSQVKFWSTSCYFTPSVLRQNLQKPNFLMFAIANDPDKHYFNKAPLVTIGKSSLFVKSMKRLTSLGYFATVRYSLAP